ncbi:MAG: TMEM165/GDT1 family protein [Candidatus Thermoplasmatota archaeon]|nr:TMEM165/GDT1 family protein [Candidatus Thermoplasmatota archaeon]
MWYLIIAVAFFSITLAELGDKSQLMAISLASKYEKRSVFLGFFLGLAVITILGITLGTIIFRIVPVIYLKVIAAIIFLLFGFYILYLEEEESDEEEEYVDRGKIMSTSFLLSFVSEFGDKTQLLVIALTVKYGAPIPVLIGGLGGLAAILIISVLIGSKLGDILEDHKVKIINSIVFISLGILFLIETLFFG